MLYDIGLQRYRDYKIRVCVKDSISMLPKSKIKYRGSIHIVSKA